MARAVGKSPRRFLVVGIAVLGCLAVLLYSARMVAADQMVASWYGPGFEGATTASGEPFDASDFTAAHKTLPFGTKLTVTLEGRSVVVRVNDRGPFIAGRDLDLSQAAAEQIGLIELGEATVNVATADPSTPTGPVSGAAAPAPEAVPAPPAPTDSGGGEAGVEADAGAEAEVEGTGVAQYADENAADEDQYANAVEDQYANAAEDQYAVEPQAAAPEAAGPVPAPAAPPAPDPSRLETPPAELATPGSTVERRVVLSLAVPPEGYEGPAPGSEIETLEPAATQPAPEPRAEPAPVAQAEPEAAPETAPEAVPSAVAGLTVLPDTGGASLVGLASGVLLVGLGVMRLREPRRTRRG